MGRSVESTMRPDRACSPRKRPSCNGCWLRASWRATSTRSASVPAFASRCSKAVRSLPTPRQPLDLGDVDVVASDASVEQAWRVLLTNAWSPVPPGIGPADELGPRPHFAPLRGERHQLPLELHPAFDYGHRAEDVQHVAGTTPRRHERVWSWGQRPRRGACRVTCHWSAAGSPRGVPPPAAERDGAHSPRVVGGPPPRARGAKCCARSGHCVSFDWTAERASCSC
jgi:hypothetical protein